MSDAGPSDQEPEHSREARLAEASKKVQRARRVYDQGEYETTQQLLEQALATRRELLGDQHPDTATAMHDLAWTLQYTPQPQLVDITRAEKLLKEAVAAREARLGDDPATAKSLYQLGLLYQNRPYDFYQGYDSPLPYYERSLEIRRNTLGDHLATAASLDRVGRWRLRLADYREAEQALREAYRIRKTLLGKRDSNTAFSGLLVGWVLLELGEYEAAAPWLSEALRNGASPKISTGEELDTTCREMLSARVDPNYDRQSLWNQAYGKLVRQHLWESLAGVRPVDRRQFCQLAVLASEVEEYPDAIALCRQAVALAQFRHNNGEVAEPEEASTVVAASLRADLARALAQGRQHSEAEVTARLALKQLSRADQSDSYAASIAHFALAAALAERNATSETLAALQKGLAIRQRLLPTDSRLLAVGRLRAGEIQRRCGKPATAISSLTAAHSVLEEVEELPWEERQLWHNLPSRARKELAWAHVMRGDVDAADSLLTSSDRRNKLQPNLLLAEIHRRRGDWAKAEEALRPRRYDRFIGHTAISSWQTRLLEAERMRRDLDRYLSVARRVNFPVADAYWSINNAKGAVYVQQRRAHLEQDTPALKPIYQRLTEVNQRLAELSGVAVEVPPVAPDEKTARMRERLLQRRNKLQRELRFRHTGMPKYAPTPLPQNLPEGVVLVDFYRYMEPPTLLPDAVRDDGAARYAAFVTRRNTSDVDSPVIHLDLGPAAPLDEAVSAWRKDIRLGEGGTRGVRPVQPAKPDAPRATPPQVLLREKLWLPVEQHLRQDDMVLISPDGPLAFLPFVALPGKQSESYLLEERMLAFAPAPSLIVPLKSFFQMEREQENLRTEQPPNRMLIVGNVTFAIENNATTNQTPASRTFAPLPGTRREVLAVRNFFVDAFANGQATLLQEAAAGESAVRKAMSDATWLHFATHGFFNATSPSAAGSPKRGAEAAESPVGERKLAAGVHSGLALAGAESGGVNGQGDGLLTALEVAALDLNHVQLAVLSACETGLGRQHSSEGVLGLQRSFRVAGVKTVVTSLWEVDDKATEALMIEFYRNLWLRKLPRQESLRLAQLAALRGELDIGWTGSLPATGSHRSNRPPPRLWAAFLLSGQWE